MIKKQVLGYWLLVSANVGIVLRMTGDWRLATIEPEAL